MSAVRPGDPRQPLPMLPDPTSADHRGRAMGGRDDVLGRALGPRPRRCLRARRGSDRRRRSGHREDDAARRPDGGRARRGVPRHPAARRRGRGRAGVVRAGRAPRRHARPPGPPDARAGRGDPLGAGARRGHGGGPAVRHRRRQSRPPRGRRGHLADRHRHRRSAVDRPVDAAGAGLRRRPPGGRAGGDDLVTTTERGRQHRHRSGDRAGAAGRCRCGRAARRGRRVEPVRPRRVDHRRPGASRWSCSRRPTC